MIKQDENGIFKIVQDGQVPVGSRQRIMKHGDTVVHLENWEDRGAGLAADSIEIVSKQTSANGRPYTSNFSVTDVHYSQEALPGDNRILRQKGHGLDLWVGADRPNEKTMDRGKPIPMKDILQPGSDWKIEKPGD